METETATVTPTAMTRMVIAMATATAMAVAVAVAVGGGGWQWLEVVTTVGTLEGGYVHNIPLPRIPQRQSTIPVACAATITESTDTYYSKVSRIPMWSELTSSLEGLGKTTSMPFFPHW